MLLLAGVFVSYGRTAASTPELTVASTRTKDRVILITNKTGRMTGGRNGFCAVFRARDTDDLLAVQNVSIDFVPIVGKYNWKPIRSHLEAQQPGRYCGEVDLGKQYYVPGNYYVFVHYNDELGKRRKSRLFISLK